MATSLGLLLTMGDDGASAGPLSSGGADEAMLSSAAHQQSLTHEIDRRAGTPWTAQELVARHQALLKHIRSPQQQRAVEEEPEGPHIEVKVTGTAHRKLAADMEQQLKAISPDVSKCYRRRLRVKPSLRGKIFFSFTLVNDGDHGRVGKAHIAASKVKDIRLESCILKAVAESRFPPAYADDVWASKERWYHYNFNLQRNNGDLRAGIAGKRTTHNP